MRYWAGVVTPEQFTTERLYAREAIAIAPSLEGEPVVGDLVALIAATEPPVLFGLGNVSGRAATGEFVVTYRQRALDEPSTVDGPVALGMGPMPSVEYTRLARTLTVDGVDEAQAEWFVSVALPIEAATRAEAVREFWTYVERLGPRELPAYVWPRGDELAMQAFVLGAITNLDPEGDDEETG
jgi:hypothetical protein